MLSDPSPAPPSQAAPDLIIRGQRVVTETGERPAAIHIKNGVIVAITKYDDVPAGSNVHDAGDSVVMPGLVDTHVHINEPGRTDWEGFTSATRAGAAGGITTIIEMPLNSIPAVNTPGALREKVAAATGKLSVDVGFWGGVVPGNADQLAPLWEAGAFGFKCFLVPSGADEFPGVSPEDLRKALPTLASLASSLAGARGIAWPHRPRRKRIRERAGAIPAKTFGMACVPPPRSRERSDRSAHTLRSRIQNSHSHRARFFLRCSASVAPGSCG